jgi:hypothetical protein
MYDAAAKAIRPILGVPGSATVGNAIDTGFSIAAAAIAPSHTYVLAVSTDGALYVVTFAAGAPSARALQTDSAPDRMVLSPLGNSGVLFYKTGAVQTITGLPDAPQLGSRIDVSGLPGVVGALAVSDDGATLLAGVTAAATAGKGRKPRAHAATPIGLFLIPQDGGPERSIAGRHVSALAFMPNSHDALIADSRTNSITLLRDVAGQASTAWVFSDPGLIEPDAVEASMDGTAVVAASSTTHVLARLDANGANAVFVPCTCAPTEVRPLSARAVYQVTESANGLLWIFDSNPPTPRVLFVPVASGSSTAPGSELQ